MTPRSLLAALLGAATMMFVLPTTAAQAAPADGRARSTAAASCWEIKQTQPSSTDGLYWVLTPTLRAPVRVHCDMTTDGGGWVLVGRGRDGWSNGGDGKGLASQVSETVGGTGAFSARQLSGATIDGLLDGRRVDALPDGIRIRRAANTAGTSWQELRLSLASRDRWSWAFDARHPLRRYANGSASSTKAQTTADAKISTDTQRMVTELYALNGYRRGFNYGAGGPKGTTAAGSYLYSSASGGKIATPFAQVWLRPRLTTADLAFPSVPDAGSPAQSAPALPRSWGLSNAWGVTGQGAGGKNKDFATEVSAFAQSGNRIYVGGNFTHVVNGAGGRKVAQPYLAAFDATTGAWISSFRPKLDNQVKALVVMPDGALVAGGQFTKVGGKTRVGLVSLDPASGALDLTWAAQVRQDRGEKRWVRALAVHGSHLYVGGAFTHLIGGTSKTWRPLSNVARVGIDNGAVDSQWAPNLGGAAKDASGKVSGGTSVNGLDVSPDGRHVQAVGYFQRGFVGDDGRPETAQAHMASVSVAKPVAFRSWSRSYSTGSNKDRRYQFAVEQVGDRVYVGGSQHSIFGYSASSLARASASVTLQGGDFQALASQDGVVYGGCHCGDFSFESDNYAGRGAGFTQGDAINFVGAWDAATGRYLPAFSPASVSRGGEGAWALHTAADGTLWAGGSYTAVTGKDGTRQWAGGFIRFPQRPHTPPQPPSGLTGTAGGGRADLRWSASPTAGVTYEVMSGGRVVETTTATSANVPVAAGGERFFVRATDGEGNRSASTSVRRVG